MGEVRIDAPRAVDQLAWWVQHAEELRLENERLRAALLHQIGGCCFCPDCDDTYALIDGTGCANSS